MAILKIKQLVDDLVRSETKVMTALTAKATSSGESGTAAKATTAGRAGTTFNLTANQLYNMFNRVAGTYGDGKALLGTGGTPGQAAGFGVSILGALPIIINGKVGTCATQQNLNVPIGTQALATYCKYLVSAGFGSNGTITAGNVASTSTAALLPDLPTGSHAPVGYFEWHTHASYPWIRGADDAARRQPSAALVRGALATAGTFVGPDGVNVGAGVDGFQNLVHMPYNQS